MLELGFDVAHALDSRSCQPGAVPAKRFEEGARVAAILRACALITGIERAIFAVGPEIRPFPQGHQAEYSWAYSPHACFAVALEEMQFLEALERPEGEIDLDAVRIDHLPVEIARQSFAYDQLVDFGAPARSHWVMRYRSCFAP